MHVPLSFMEIRFTNAAFSSSNAGNPIGVLIVIGGLCAVIMIIAVIIALVGKAKDDRLRRNGTWIRAIVQDIQYQTRSVVAGTPPNETRHNHEYYILVGIWTDPATGSHYTFASGELSSRPGYMPGNEVAILVDPSNYSNYQIEM